MIAIRKKYATLVIVGLSLFTSTSTLLAQEKIQYKGPLQVNKYTGDAIYHYKIVDNDTLLDGSFQLQRSNLQALLNNEDVSFSFKGDFKNNFPTGLWNFKFGEFKSNSQSEVIDYQYRVSVSGTQEEAAGSIIEGKPHGKWLITENRIKDSEIEKTLFKSNITFENGLPQQSFRIENDEATLVGRFLRNGLAHDEWALYSSQELEATESWYFDNGVLERIRIQNENKTTEVRFPKNPSIHSKIITLDASYLKALQLQIATEDATPIFKGILPALLKQNATHYQKIDAILSELGESKFLPEFKVRVPFYPLTPQEISQLDSIQLNFKKAKAITKSYLNNTQLNILKLSDTEADFYYRVIQNIEENYLNSIERMVEYQDEYIIELIDRNHLIAKVFNSKIPSTVIEIKNPNDGSTRVFKLANANTFKFSTNRISSVGSLSKYALASLDSIDAILKKKLAQEQRQQELVELEETLIAENKELQALVDSLQKDAPLKNKKALQKIKAIADTELSTYASLDDAQNKLAAARKLAVCFTQLDSLGHAVTAIPAQQQEIQELYQDGIWNPFMATVMDEEVKKRITQAYRKILIPYFLNEIEQHLSCSNAEIIVQQMQTVYQRMLALRDEETSKLERKLRKEKNPEEIIKLIQEPTTGKQK